MAHNLSIKLDVDTGAIDKLKSALSDKIEANVDLNFKSLDTKISSLKSSLEGVGKTPINVKVETSAALSSLESLRDSYTTLKTSMESGIDLKINFESSTKDLMNSMQKAAQKAHESAITGSNSTISANQVGPGKEFLSNYEKLAEMQKYINDNQNKMSDNTTKTVKDNYTQSQSVREMVKTMKELEKAQDNILKYDGLKDDGIAKALKARETSLKDYQAQLQSQYQRNYGKDIMEDGSVKATQNLLEYNRVLKQAAQEQQSQEANLKTLVKLENDKHKAIVAAEKATGPAQAKELLDQSAAIQKQIELVKQADGAWDKMSSSQQSAFQSLQNQNQISENNTRAMMQAKESDKMFIQDQKRGYAELERTMKDYYNTQEKVAQLEAQQEAGSISGKDSLKLDSLNKELEVRKQIMETAKKAIAEEGLTDKTSDNRVANLEKERSLRLDAVQQTSKINAELKKTEKAYKDIEDSVKRQSQLNKQLENAGNSEASQIRQLIAEEEKYQAQIRETNNLKGQGNTAREDEISDLKERNQLELKNAEAIRKARKTDEYNERLMTNSSLTQMIDPRAVYNQGKQVFQYVYGSVKQLDDAMVQVKKVADATPQEFSRFEREIFDMASAVGKGADEYAVSVERWAAAGYDLNEANRMAGFSTMGAFVGNLDEAATVDYMSVPLIAYKNAGLEAWDVLNAMNEVANNNAAEMDVLGAAYQRAASTAANAGTSFSELTGLIGAAEETTRLGGETIGTSLRTMDINIGKIATRDTKGFQDKFDFLQDLGVDILDANGELNSTYNVLEQLQKVWGELDTVTQTKAATTLAGSRGQAIMTAWMNNWDKVQKMQKEAEGQIGLPEGTGSAYDEFEAMQDSLMFKQVQLQNAWSEFLHVASGGAEPFGVVLDFATQLVDKMTELAEIDGVREIAGAIGKAFGALVGTVAISKGFTVLSGAVMSTFSSLKGIGTLFSGGGLSTLFGGGVGGFFTGILSGFGKLIPLVGGVITLMTILDPLMKKMTGVGTFEAFGKGLDWAYGKIAPLQKRIGDAYKEQDRLIESLADNKLLSGELSTVSNAIDGYARLGIAKQQAFEASGDSTVFEWDDSEFSSMQAEFNGMVESLDLDHDLKITWNNHDHIMQQLADFNKEMVKITRDETERAMKDTNDLLRSRVDPKDLYDDWFEGKPADDIASKNLMNETATVKGIQEAYARELKFLQDTNQDTTESVTQLSKDAAEAERITRGLVSDWLSSSSLEDAVEKNQTRVDAVKKSYEQMTDVMGNLALGDVADSFDTFFRGFDSDGDGARETFIMAAVEAGNYGEQLKLAAEAGSELTDFQQKFASGEVDNTAARQWAKEFTQTYGDVLKELDVGTILEGQTVDQAFLADLEDGGDRILRLQNAITDYRDSAQQDFAELENVLKSYKDQYGLTDGQIEGLMRKSTGSAAEFAAALVDVDEGLAALQLFGERDIAVIGAFDRMNEILGTDTSWSDVFVSLQEDIDGLSDVDIEVTQRMRFVTDDGQASSYLLEQMAALETMAGSDFMVNMGINVDGDYDMMAFMDFLAIDKDTTAQFGIEVDSQTGLADIQSIIDVLNSDQRGEFMLALEADTTNYDEAMSQVTSKSSEELMQEFNVDVKFNFNTESSGDAVTEFGNTAQSYFDTTFAENELVKELDISYFVNDDGSADLDSIAQNIQNMFALGGEEAIEMEQAIRVSPHVEIADDETIGIDHITQFLAGTFNAEGSESEYTILKTIFTEWVLDKGNANADEIIEEIESELEDMEAEAQVGLNITTTGAEGLGGIGAEGLGIPESVETVWTILQEGEVSASTIDDLINNMPDSVVTQYSINTGNSTEAIEQINSILEGMNTEQQVDFLVNAIGIEDAQVIQEILAAADGDSAETSITLSATGVEQAETVSGAMDNVDGRAATASLDVDASGADGEVDTVVSKLDEVEGKNPQARVGADASGFHSVMAGVDASLARQRSTTVRILGDPSGYNSVLAGLRTRSVTVSINASRSASQSIGAQIGTSFSASIGSQLTGRSGSTRVGRSASTETKVNEDVWRYWAKELYQGLPIEKSLDELANQLKMAGDNQDELIKLYRQQISTIDRQIAHERDMRKAEQEEMNYILGELKKQGFTASGNQITNLDRAKSLTGDTASDVEKLLNDWKSLYESIDKLDTTISKLELDKFNTEQDITDAKIEKELQKIEARLKTTEALMRSVENNTGLQATREKFIGAEDYDLMLGVNEQGINTASSAIKELMKEYNNLAKMTVEYDENAEEVYSTMEDLKGIILENADSILEYREQIKQVELDRLIGDFSKFADVMSNNADIISNNIEQMKEGLLSGQSLDDLPMFGELDIVRKTQLERDYELRLQLENDLNNALQAYSDKNIDKAVNESNQILSIEAQKYAEMLRLAKEYSNGVAAKPEGIGKVPTTSVEETASQTQYDLWKDKLEKLTVDYSTQYAEMVERYQKAIDSVGSDADKQALRNNMIIEQLELQEKIYRDMIAYNNEFIELSEKELENTTLTTEQRNALLATIQEYKNSNIDAQNAIRQTIADRFDFEFSLMDKALEKAQKYSDSLAHILNVADLVNVSPGGKAPIYDAIYEGIINQYTEAKRQLASLTEQQSQFSEGSYEWGILADKIQEVREQMQGFGVDALNTNRDILNNALESVRDTFEKGLLDDKTLDEWKKYHENWVSGVEKELALENLRQKSMDYENELIQKRLEALDRQEEVSKKDLDYLDKQLKIIELESKLANLENERNVQTLVRRDDGTYAWDYVADQTEYDKTQKELNDAKAELEKYKREQRQSYVEDLGSIIDKAQNGGYDSTADLQTALEKLRDVYGVILGDIPDLGEMSFEEILAAYDKYLAANDLVAGDLIGAGSDSVDSTLNNIGKQFEESFLNIASDLGKIIGEELRSALGISMNQNGGIAPVTYNIDNVSLPNVTDGEGFANFFNDLPRVAKQEVAGK